MVATGSILVNADPTTESNYPMTATFPANNLTLTGMAIISPNFHTRFKFQLDVSETAIIPANGIGYWQKDFSYTLKGNQLNFFISGANSNMQIIFYYGKPRPNAPPLSAYKAIEAQLSWSVPESAINGVYSTSALVTMQKSASVIKAMDHILDTIQGTATVGGVYYEWNTSVGEKMYLGLPLVARNGSTVPAVSGQGINTQSGLPALAQKVNSTFTLYSTIIANNSSTTDSQTVTDLVLLYYE